MKKFLAVLLSVSMVLCMTACGSKTETEATPASKVDTASYPKKPITCVVPFTAGGGTDVIARMMASMFPNYCDGATLVVENQAGGAAVPGTIYVMDADNDGYTISYSFQANWTMRQHVLETADYTLDDATLICGIEMQHNGIFVNADSPFKTIEDLINYAKANPGKLKYSTGPAASYQEIVANAFMMKTGVDALNVYYEGARQAALGMMAGDLDFTILQATTYSSELGAGTVRMLASCEAERCQKDVPTCLEKGIDVNFSHRSLIFGPAGLPDEIVNKLEKAFEGICKDETFLKLAGNSNADIQFCGHEQLYKETVAQDDACIEVIKATMNYIR